MVKFTKHTEFIRLKYKLFNIIVICFIFSENFYAQYSVYDYDLIKTTAERSFNTEIISAYLFGEDATNVNAALLSIANSKDTSFDSDITKLDFNKHAKFITFALGELGPSEVSSKYLFSKIATIKDSLILRYCYDALGKVGNQHYLRLILNKNDYGVALAFYQFVHRKINNDKELMLKTLFRSLLSNRNDSLKLNDVLFTLSRIGADSTFIPLLTAALFNSDKNISVQSKIFALDAFRRLKYFPPLPELLNILVNHKDWRIRTEAAKVYPYYAFSSVKELTSSLGLLYDGNPNVARQTAISLKDISIPTQFRDDTNKFILTIILENKLPPAIIGELFVSFSELNSFEDTDVFSKISSSVKAKYLFKSISVIPENSDFMFKLLKSKKFNVTSSNENEYFEALMSLQDSLQHSEEYAQFVIDNLKTGSPSAVGIISASLNDNLLKHKRISLINTITELVRANKNNDNYLESLPSLAEIAKKIAPSFYSQILKSLSTSNISSIKNYALQKLGEHINKNGIAISFDKLWEFSFKYSKANVITNTGNFTVKFLPNYAPISVGNFCYLASTKFYDGAPFHRVVPNFVIQTGDKLGTGWGGPGYEIISEFSPLPFNSSAVGMASAGRDTEGSQWFVMHSNSPHLNGRYTVFGEVISGKSIVDKINILDKIIRIDLIK